MAEHRETAPDISLQNRVALAMWAALVLFAMVSAASRLW